MGRGFSTRNIAFRGSRLVGPSTAQPFADTDTTVVARCSASSNGRPRCPYAVSMSAYEPAWISLAHVLIAYVPVPPADAPYSNFCDKRGRFGSHNPPHTKAPGKAHPNFTAYSYFNAGVQFFDISDPAHPRNTGYFLNSKYIFFRPHVNRNFVPIGDERMSTNQDAIVRLIGWAGNMTASGLQFQGVMTE